jgi:hypothetical protein
VASPTRSTRKRRSPRRPRCSPICAASSAAWNAPPPPITRALRGEGDLPAETRAYVRFVTADLAGAPPAAPPDSIDPEPPAPQSCLALTEVLRRDRGDDGDEDPAPFAPWGVQLAGNFSKARALATFERARRRYAAVIGDEQPMIIGRLLRSRGTRRFYQVRLPAPSRQVAAALCGRIQAVGGACVAMRS